ncbi:hypothetical protein [Cellulomonas sp. Leaf334]|uniref:hypothetical protein n=1 Tax=Cellulomonas sp. Leaf334 TaxID=1736339 RepID=UPI0012E2D8F7|nr:hypothetical protein [Cellulomonas sp. Leaf334]
MGEDPELAALQRLSAAVLLQGRLAEGLKPELGPRDPGNLLVLADILAAQSEARAAHAALVDMGAIES